MMTAVVQQKQQVPPSVLLIGKKRALDYVAPALYRINDTGELIIKAIGSLSIVTAVDVAEIVKRDMTNVATRSIKVGTDELRIGTGELKRMSSIEIHLIKVNPIVVAQPTVDFHVPVEDVAAVEIPIGTAPDVAVDIPVLVAEAKAKKPRAKRKSSKTAKKKSSRKKKKSASV